MDRSASPEAYRTRGGIEVTRSARAADPRDDVEALVDALDAHRGVLLASSYEVPGRYTRYDMGFIDPPLAVVSRDLEARIEALNDRGRVLLPPIRDALGALPAVRSLDAGEDCLRVAVRPARGRFPEEQRSRQPSVFSVLRALLDLFGSPEDPHLGLYGAFGYDLVFQFEPFARRLPREADQRDLVLYLPDRLLVVDHQRGAGALFDYDFAAGGRSTRGLAREGVSTPYRGCRDVEPGSDHAPGEYAEIVRVAREAFRRGDLFEVVPGQTFTEPCPEPPSELFRRLRERNPSPYGFLIHLGAGEYLVGASPEMYVRVEGRRVETCPISGTIARGADPIEDAEQIRRLLSSEKDESELTMCTDVDRNDKSRICVPGSVRVLARRQIEIYSRLIHTVDHVEGQLREGFDALDAFLTHAWAVTVTGAPKRWAMRFLEEHEKSPRRWYGGAVGTLGFDGSANTGLTLRTIRISGGVAEVRVGATLLYDSDPDAEEAETRLKAAAFLDALRRPRSRRPEAREPQSRPGTGRRVLLVDNEDSFVHTLADYFRQTGAEVHTLRVGFAADTLDELDPDLVVISPGPGRPSDFGLSGLLDEVLARELPVFGVCLGLQAIAEHFGGKLGTLPEPVHGKASRIRVLGGRLFRGFPEEFQAGRYHSLFAERESLPAELQVTAESDDGVVMALEHTSLPLAAVQFHPESILTLQDELGHRLIRSVVGVLARAAAPAGAQPPAAPLRRPKGK